MTDMLTTEAELDALYAPPGPVALLKEVDHIADAYRPFIELSPFFVIASAGPEGLDCTPRGDPPGTVRVLDRRTLAIPDRRGNGRLDTLRNLTHDPRVALLFFVPGVNRTLRVNGRARISVELELRRSFVMNGDKLPASVLLVTAERVYSQCPKALVRSKLWDPAGHVDEARLPSSGSILKSIQHDFDAEGYDRAYPARLRETIY